MDAYLKTEHLDAGYDGKAILHDVCLRVQRGRIVTLIGPNGSGKSTILKTIISQLPAIGGSVVLDGQDLRKQSRSDIARRMAILMTARMNPELMSCRDVVSSGRYPYTGRLGVLRAEDKQIVEESLRQTDALDFADKPFRAVSDGQRQRILLARALCQQPELIVLDEPTAMLDPQGRRDVLQTVRRLNREAGITIILITHHMDEAAQADRVIAMETGRILCDGTPKEVFTQVEKLQQAGLTVPQTTQLLYRLRSMGYDLPLDALSVTECAQALHTWLEA